MLHGRINGVVLSVEGAVIVVAVGVVVDGVDWLSVGGVVVGVGVVLEAFVLLDA